MKELIILCYHGIVDDIPKEFNSSGKHLKLEIFQKQMQYIKQNFEIVTMRDVENYYQGNGYFPKKSVAVTFDDGYANNLKIAHPVLANLGVKATLYLASGYLSGNRLMWTDELELAILNMTNDELKIKLENEKIYNVSTLNHKISALTNIKKLLKKSSPDKIISLLHHLKVNKQSHQFSVHEELHSFLNWEEVRFMHKSGIWEIGAHTVDHYSLGVLNPIEGISQIAASIHHVKKELNLTETPLFSYPEGLKLDMPKYAVDFLKHIGIKSAPSALSGKNILSRSITRSSLSLKRHLVGFENTSFPWDI